MNHSVTATERRPLEKHLAAAVSGLLRIDGWRVIKQEPLSRAGGGRYAGELGMPDLLALRYAKPVRGWGNGILWIEVKRKGQKPKPHQLEWHAAERALGAEVMVVDDYDQFKEWYLRSGLNRSLRGETPRPGPENDPASTGQNFAGQPK